MFSKEKIRGCGSLKCNNIWVFEDELHKKVSFSQYVTDYENKAKVYICDSHGEADYSKIYLEKAIEQGFVKYMKKLKLGSHCKYPNKLWSEKWFLLSLAENDITYPDGKTTNYNSPKLSADDRAMFLKNVQEQVLRNPSLKHKGIISLQKEPVFYFFDMRGSCDYNDVKDNFSSKNSDKTESLIIDKTGSLILDKTKRKSRKTSSKIHPMDNLDNRRRSKKKSKKYMNLVLIGSEMCGSCRKTYTKLSKKHKVKKMYYDDIKTAVKEARKYAKNQGIKEYRSIKTIPAVFDKKTGELLDM
jgi:hypothetical protein